MALQQMAFKYGVPDLLRGVGGNGGAVVYNSATGKYEVPPFDQDQRQWYLRGLVLPGAPSQQPPPAATPEQPSNAPPSSAAPSPTSPVAVPPMVEADGAGSGGMADYGGFDGGALGAIGNLGFGGVSIGGLIGSALGGPVGGLLGNAIGSALGIGGSDAGLAASEGGEGVSMGTAAGGDYGNAAELGLGAADSGMSGMDGNGGGFGGDSGDGYAQGGRVRKLADKYGVRRNFASGGLNELSPELRGFLESDAVANGISNPTFNFIGAGPGQAYGLQLLDGSTPERAATAEPMVVSAAREPSPSGRSVDPGLAALFAQYQGKSPYAEDISRVTSREQAEMAELNKLIDAAAQQKDSGPSKAEMYFRLAAAFGAPTKSGNFFESLGNAGTAMAGYSKEKRDAASSSQQRALQLQMEKRKLGIQSARDELSTLRTLAGQDAQAQRQMQLELVKDYIASGKPQSEAGKIAIDSGLKPNTPEYNKFVADYVQQKLDSGDMYKAIMANVATQGLALRQEAERRQAEAARRLTPTEIKMREETEDAISAARSAAKALREAIRINDKTFTRSAGDIAQRAAMELVKPDDDRVVNTRIIENLLTGQGLDQLKSTFGAAPTEGERAILMEIQGAGSKSLKERKMIMERALTALEEREARNRKKLEEILSGAYRTTTPAEAKPEGDK